MTPEVADLFDWSKGEGLLPAIVQDASTGVVLMLGFMNREALGRTLETGRVTFFSRRRRQLWTKGETSGNWLSAVHVSADCDADAILVQAHPTGPVCHAGTPSCFVGSRSAEGEELAFLARLERVIDERISSPSSGSHTAKLHAEGLRRIAQKVGEEGLELALAGAGGSQAEVLSEGADLVFHLLLLLRERGLSLARVAAELERRHAARRTESAKPPVRTT